MQMSDNMQWASSLTRQDTESGIRILMTKAHPTNHHEVSHKFISTVSSEETLGIGLHVKFQEFAMTPKLLLEWSAKTLGPRLAKCSDKRETFTLQALAPFSELELVPHAVMYENLLSVRFQAAHSHYSHFNACPTRLKISLGTHAHHNQPTSNSATLSNRPLYETSCLEHPPPR